MPGHPCPSGGSAKPQGGFPTIQINDALNQMNRLGRYATVATIALIAGALLGWSPLVNANEAALWKAAKTPGHVVLIRHALAPGTGDPSHFRVDDCSTQRNLSQGGRDQARHIGKRFRQHGISSANVQASQWCRCLDTARLLDLGPVRANPLLNSFFANRADATSQNTRLRAWIAAQSTDAPLILVTHQVNITELTGVYPGSGEIVVAKRRSDGAVDVIGTIKTE